MVYVITITQTTGKIIEQVQFSDLAAAKNFYQQVIETTSYKRVLVLLLEKPAPLEENILEVEYIEGVTYIHPATTFAAVATTGVPGSENRTAINTTRLPEALPDFSSNHSSPASSN